ncbi:MAG: glutaminase domain-containing protein [Fimbriimonas sp.]
MTYSTARTLLFGTLVAVSASSFGQAANRPPAVPLIAHDPYFSVWSTTDELPRGTTRHWTGAAHPLTSLVRIDGQTYRLMGDKPENLPVLAQTGLQVTPTRTIYTFKHDVAEVRLTFTTPTLPDDLDILSRPATYVTWDVRATDGRTHDASVYFDASGLLAVNRGNQRVFGAGKSLGKLTALRIGSEEQSVLTKSGDDLRIDWGHLYVAAPTADGTSSALVTTEAGALAFARDGRLARSPRFGFGTRPASDGYAAAFALSLGKVGANPVSRHLTVAYDDQYSIQYFGQNLRPYWRRKGMDADDLLKAAEADYAKLTARCEAFDREVTADMTRLGGANYAYLGALAYRQTFAAQKVAVDAKGQPLMFSKENFSNGCIATVDILYPHAPSLLLFSPVLMKATLVPVLEYANSPRWKFPFAPHDLGTYPLANGQVYGGGERTEENQMPVEESGNMLIVLAALAKVEGNADFAEKYWPLLQRWAVYLADKGFDPESQLSTDDFAGHLAHNVNLSAKAIEALGAYAYLAETLGKKDEAAKYRTLAQSFADRWVKEAADGDHTKLAFDRPGTWAQKYNLVWDRLLGFNLFPASVARKELAYYRTKQNAYGLPLDSRRDYTKLDWIVWSATLTGDRSDFDALIGPIVKFMNATPDRVPMTDWFRTEVPRKEGFQARSVVGGVFIKMLEDPTLWRKYAMRDKRKVGGWLPIPKPPIVTPVVPNAEESAFEWSYTTERPTDNWFLPGTDVSAWKKGPAGFGTSGTPGAVVRTQWNTSDIWIRREFDLPTGNLGDLQLYVHHDEDAEVYINGVLAARLGGFLGKYEPRPLTPAGKAALKPGRNVIAIHCHQTTGGQYIDAGFATVKPAK